MPTYESDIEIGATYRDLLTGFEGVAVYVSFNLTGCERVALDAIGLKDDVKAFEFDATRLERIASPSKKIKKITERVLATAPGGPTTRVTRH